MDRGGWTKMTVPPKFQKASSYYWWSTDTYWRSFTNITYSPDTYTLRTCLTLKWKRLIFSQFFCKTVVRESSLGRMVSHVSKLKWHKPREWDRSEAPRFRNSPTHEAKNGKVERKSWGSKVMLNKKKREEDLKPNLSKFELIHVQLTSAPFSLKIESERLPMESTHLMFNNYMY